jgi:hypothetical protein
MLTNFTPKTPINFNCEFCDFKCIKKSDWKRHNSTLKHKILTNTYKENAESADFFCDDLTCNKFVCDCGKEYKHRQSLHAHKKKGICKMKDQEDEEFEDDDDDESKSDLSLLTNLIMEMMKSNQDLQKSLFEVCKNGTANSNTQISNSMVNSNNKTFNLQVFLNETCKDAMNLTDFVNSLQIQLSDLENVGKNGFVAGISNIIVKNLKALDVTQRPVHCSDQKREVIYIKDQDQWFNDSKEAVENQKLKKAIRQIAHKNICMIPEWKKLYPDCVFADSRKSDLYNHIMYESMDHNEANSEKIIKKIAKEMVIESSFKKPGL